LERRVKMFVKGGSTSETGKRGEDIAAEFLKKKRYKILERNWRPGVKGAANLELDIVARRGEDIVFVEVKALSRDDSFSPEDHFTAPKARRVRTAARLWLAENGFEAVPWQVDLVAVVIRGEFPDIRHHERVA